MTIGEKIREIRKEKGISQKELGTLLGVSQQMIGQYENSSREPKIETLRKIAAALKVKLSDFLEVGQIIEEYNPVDNTTDTIVKMEDEIIQGKIISSFTFNADTYSNEELLLTEREKRLVEYFRLLNNKGQDKALEDVELYTLIDTLRKRDDIPDK